MLKLFTDKEYLPKDQRHVVLLDPFWGNIPEPAGDKDSGRFDAYCQTGKDFFSLVPIEDADAALLPGEWRTGSPEAVKLAEKATKYGKKVIIFFNSDSVEPIPIENTVIFRTSFYRSARRPNEFAMPGWSADFLHRYLDGKLPVRKKGPVPVVGYTGYIDYSNQFERLKKFTRNLVRFRRKHIGEHLRGTAVRALQQNPRVSTNFIIRSGFLGECQQDLRLEYVLNIVDCDYALVARGGGNFSYRLYEVLSCGRIPVFIDTDCVLPFDHLIDWRKYCVWVESKDIESIGDKVADFHARISDEDFRELQMSIRRMYEEWISPVGFHRNLWRCIPREGSKFYEP